MFRTLIIGAMFILAHYLQQLDMSRLIINNHLIQKQQDSLSSYFKAKKDGVIIFYNDAKQKGINASEETPESLSKHIFEPILMLKNATLNEMISLDIQSLSDSNAS